MRKCALTLPGDVGAASDKEGAPCTARRFAAHRTMTGDDARDGAGDLKTDPAAEACAADGCHGMSTVAPVVLRASRSR